MTNREFFVQTWQHELKITAGVVRALPHDMKKLDYKLSSKSRSASEIISHLLPHAEAKNKETKNFCHKRRKRRFYQCRRGWHLF